MGEGVVEENAPEQRFDVTVAVRIRPCREEDLPALEWFGMHSEHREIIRDTWRRASEGRQLMLVAEVNGFPAGQLWLDLEKRRQEKAAVVWALRVFPLLQRVGIGARLLEAAEHAATRKGFVWIELGVERDNPEAEKLYRRVGFERIGELTEQYTYLSPAGAWVRAVADQWLLRKRCGQ